LEDMEIGVRKKIIENFNQTSEKLRSLFQKKFEVPDALPSSSEDEDSV